MNEIVSNLASLIKVKTIITLVVIAVFAVLALNGRISADNVMIIISMVVSFYFGTQHVKKSENAAKALTAVQTEMVISGESEHKTEM